MRLAFCILLLFSFNEVFNQELLPATFFGSYTELKEFIKREMVYPPRAILDKIEGKVLLTFYIKKDGEVDHIEVTESVNSDIDNEALRIARKILWCPAQFDGKNVNDKQCVTFIFNINKYNKWCRGRGYKNLIYPYKAVDSSYCIYSLKDVTISPEAILDDPEITLIGFISREIIYPESALNLNISGTVRVHFIVETNGLPSNIMIKKHLGAGCSEEAIRLVKMIKWKPGIENGQAVRTRMHLNVTFNLANQKSYRDMGY